MNNSTVARVAIPDSPNNDAFEAIVELYYQLRGYITSSGKWFGVKDKEKQQRGYADMDVLAVNGKETLIVSVTTCLKQKIDKGGEIEKLVTYYKNAEEYLKGTECYEWMGEKGRIKKVIAYKEGYKQSSAMEKYKEKIEGKGITIISGEEIAERIGWYLSDTKSQDGRGRDVCIRNPLLKIVEFMQEYYVPTSPEILEMIKKYCKKNDSKNKDQLIKSINESPFSTIRA